LLIDFQAGRVRRLRGWITVGVIAEWFPVAGMSLCARGRPE